MNEEEEEEKFLNRSKEKKIIHIFKLEKKDAKKKVKKKFDVEPKKDNTELF